jgi:hypothetical protein
MEEEEAPFKESLEGDPKKRQKNRRSSKKGQCGRRSNQEGVSHSSFERTFLHSFRL